MEIFWIVWSIAWKKKHRNANFGDTVKLPHALGVRWAAPLYPRPCRSELLDTLSLLAESKINKIHAADSW